MSSEADAFSVQLLEEAKRFAEHARENPEEVAFRHASLVLGFSSLEAHINGVADELSLRQNLLLTDEAVLLERGLRLKDGEWRLTSHVQYYGLQDRLAFLLLRFSGADAAGESWWSDLAEAVSVRNGLVHPRDAVLFSVADLERYLLAIVDALDSLYRAVFKRGHPAQGRGLQSTLSF